MIADLMLFARPPRPQPKTVNLRQLLEKVLDEYRHESAERGIELSMESPDISLRADPTQLAVAVRAVVANSFEAIGRKGQVAISARMAGPAVQIVVRDTGPGIPSEVRRHLFDPFFSGRSAGRGLGTGLSKCWQIIRQHGGQIDVESTHHQGATFIISLPCP
jgi:signal transduction histidine kinase